MKRNRGPLNVITLCGRDGIVVGDGRPRNVPLATNRVYDLTVSKVLWSGEVDECAATRRASLWQRVRKYLRIGVYG